MYGGESLVHLLRMHQSIKVGGPPAVLNDLKEVMEFDGHPEDLDQLWGQ